MTNRHLLVSRHFASALDADDFIARAEIALCGYGFTGGNSIAMTNLCRDEVTTVLKDKIDQAFGCSFNTNGLGAVLTCGLTGIKAGLSHAPVAMEDGRERYVFFSFPHIAINASGEVGAISRPGRPGPSCACGALIKSLDELKAEGVSESSCKAPGVHDALDPEYSILKQRLARRLRHERLDVSALDLAAFTAVAERVVTDDLEYLIAQCVDPSRADYAVVTGVSIHNWATEFGDGQSNLEFVAPTKCYVVVDGSKTHLDLSSMPSLSPRQLRMLSAPDRAGSGGKLLGAHPAAAAAAAGVGRARICG